MATATQNEFRFMQIIATPISDRWVATRQPAAQTLLPPCSEEARQSAPANVATSERGRWLSVDEFTWEDTAGAERERRFARLHLELRQTEARRAGDVARRFASRILPSRLTM